METVQDWGDAVMVSVTTALQNFLGFLPALVGAILILILGWIVAPWTGFPAASTMIPPTDHAASSVAVKRDGIDPSRFPDDQPAQYGP